MATIKGQSSRLLPLLLFLAVAMLSHSTSAEAGESPMLRRRTTKEKTEASITVMTRNMYIGFSIALLSEQGPLAALAQFQATDFGARAVAMASEICATQPDLIALQEVSTLSIGSPAVDILDLQFLPLLLTLVGSCSLSYSVGVTATNGKFYVCFVQGNL